MEYKSFIYLSNRLALGVEEIVELLQHYDPSKVSNSSTTDPRPGDVFIFRGIVNAAFDNSQWLNNGCRLFPKRNSRLRKTYYKLATSPNDNSAMCRHVYKAIGSTDNVVLVHYTQVELDRNEHLVSLDLHIFTSYVVIDRCLGLETTGDHFYPVSVLVLAAKHPVSV